jgi:hypothetical protein
MNSLLRVRLRCYRHEKSYLGNLVGGLSQILGRGIWFECLVENFHRECVQGIIAWNIARGIIGERSNCQEAKLVQGAFSACDISSDVVVEGTHSRCSAGVYIICCHIAFMAFINNCVRCYYVYLYFLWALDMSYDVLETFTFGRGCSF